MMTKGENRRENPYAALERAFHEPNRLAILSALCSAPQGLTFSELKDRCALTDGNLNRHLKTLEEADTLEIEKRSAGARSQTVIRLSAAGRDSFLQYLQALEAVLKKAAAAMVPEKRASAVRGAKTARP